MEFEVQYVGNPFGKDNNFICLFIYVLYSITLFIWAEHSQGLKFFHF